MFRPKWKLITNRHQMLTYIHIASRWPSCKHRSPYIHAELLQMIRLNFLTQTGKEHKKQAPTQWARAHTRNTRPSTQHTHPWIWCSFIYFCGFHVLLNMVFTSLWPSGFSARTVSYLSSEEYYFNYRGTSLIHPCVYFCSQNTMMKLESRPNAMPGTPFRWIAIFCILNF